MVRHYRQVSGDGGLEVGMPSRETVGEHCEYVGVFSTWLIRSRLTNILPRK